ncbi:hypothetical protein E4U57_002950 [Claviceps arundinis]|uniref:Uncharacterized protein n=1 Tax=Claviceps arundinis TaxID=1623583 RepID=A0ABQ7P7P4_9HYPO|nr:hypothetical protein E4U57_002950 [Claviceps arundinis]
MACYDGRLITGSNYDEARGDFFGPFVNEDEFNDTLRSGALPNVAHSSGNGIVLTHGDLNLRTIMMHNGGFRECIPNRDTLTGKPVDGFQTTGLHQGALHHNTPPAVVEDCRCCS